MEDLFGVLCSEMTEMILGFLLIEDKKNARQVCRKWCNIIDYSMNFNVPFNDGTIKWVMKSNIGISHLTLENCNSILVVSASRNQFAKRVKSLTIESLRNKDSIHLLRHFTLINKLIFSAGSFIMDSSFSIQFLTFSCLKKLVISVRGHNEKQTRAFVEFGHGVKCPSLMDLCLDWGNYGSTPYSGLLFVQDYMAMFALISNHNNSLRILRMKVPDLFTQIVGVNTITYRQDELESRIKRINQVDLVELSIKFSVLEGIVPFTLGQHLMKSQKRLTNLVISGSVFPAIEDTIRTNSRTLTSFGLISTPRGNFNCEAFEHCSNLNLVEIFTPLTSQLLNVNKIPRTVKNFFHKGPLAPFYVNWLTENLTLLEEASFLNPQGSSYNFSFYNLLSLITKTSVKKISIWCPCDEDEILSFCSLVPGLEPSYVHQTLVPDTPLYIIHLNRELLNSESEWANFIINSHLQP